MATLREPSASRGISAPETLRETPPEIANLRWSPEWTTLLVRALDGDKDARRIWELLDAHGDPDAAHVLATLGYLEAGR